MASPKCTQTGTVTFGVRIKVALANRLVACVGPKVERASAGLEGRADFAWGRQPRFVCSSWSSLQNGTVSDREVVCFVIDIGCHGPCHVPLTFSWAAK